MNKVILQIWEESERGWGTRPDGCSLHTDSNQRDEYLSSIYKNRGGDVPDEYDRIVGNPIEVFVDDDLYEKVLQKSIRLFENEMNNLIKLEEITIKR